jgi:hypothetical protein
MPRKLPAALIASLDGFYRHFGLEDCLQFLSRELGRLGITEYDLPPYQRALFVDLWDPLDDWALAQMHHYWEYDLERLQQRGRGWNKHIPAKPKIDVWSRLPARVI